MQQLTIEHKKSTSNKNKTTEQVEKTGMTLRELKGREILSRNVLRLIGSDSYYCKSESKDIWYFVRYEPSWSWCSCFDNSMRHIRCKHIFAVEYSIRKCTLVDVSALPKELKRFTNIEQVPTRLETYTQSHTSSEENRIPNSWRNDQYGY
jgi:hypothetical protein